jgi:hypothetical protein
VRLHRGAHRPGFTRRRSCRAHGYQHRPAAPGVGDAGALGEWLGFQRVAGKLIETDLHQPYLDGVTAHVDRG